MKAPKRCAISSAATVCIVALLAATNLHAATIYVTTAGNDGSNGLSWGTAKKTVQAGINAATSSDQVWVAAGTYVQCITLKAGVGLYGGFAGTETDLSQRNWTTNVTILDGNQAGSVVTVPPTTSADTRIDGFTIRNGSGTELPVYYWSRYGGGIYCDQASPTIANNTISNNAAISSDDGYGGGIYCNGGSPTITNNTIADNMASAAYNSTSGADDAGYGGGIYCNGGSPTITNNTITGNTARGYYDGDGGGISCSAAIIVDNTITGNTAQASWSAFGGGISCDSGTIAGNTITGNTASGVGEAYGGGIITNGGALTILNNTIGSNLADAVRTASGGGIYCSGPETITNNAIVNNKVTGDATTGHGGGITSYLTPDGVIANNTILGNNSPHGGGINCSGSETVTGNTIANNITTGFGGGIHCVSSSTTTAGKTIANNTITGNVGYDGGGIYCFAYSATVVDVVMSNMIAGNSATDAGGGILCVSSTAMIVNNTIIKNSVPTYGGGVYCDGSSSPVLVNTVVAFNSSGIYNSSGSPIVRSNCVYGNDAYNYSGLPDPTGTNGNISVDPKLADASYGNLHIQPDSPCVDAGDDSVILAGWVDTDGQARIQGAHVDIGADESDGTVWAAGPIMIVRVSPAGSDANDGSSWALAKRTVQAALNAACGLGGEVWVQGGTYHERIVLLPFTYLYGGFAGTETQRSERDWSNHLTVLDGDRTGSVVTAIRISPGLSTIDGFTIRNGTGTVSGSNLFGGGIYCSYASPVIAHCTLTANTATLGGGIYGTYSSPAIADNTIVGNSATSIGGGIYCSYGSPSITSNTVTANSAGAGGGIYCASSSVTILNTIVAFNSSGFRKSGTIVPILGYNCVYGNGTANYAGLTDPTGTNGNISSDPLFVQQAGPGADGKWGTADDVGDLHLTADSPCRNAGDPAYVPTAGETDIDGQPRVMADRADIGADEFTWVGDVNLDGFVDVVDLLSLVYAFGTATGDPAYDPACDFNHDGAVDVADLLDLVYNFGK